MLKFLGFVGVVVILIIGFSSCGGCNFFSGCSDVTNSITGIIS